MSLQLKSSLKRFVKMGLAAMVGSILTVPMDFSDWRKYLLAALTAAVAGLLGFLDKFLRWKEEETMPV